MINLVMCFLGLWNWFVRGTWRVWSIDLEKPLNAVIGLLTHSNETLEDYTAEVSTDSRGLLLEVLEENKDSVRNQDHLYDSLAGSSFILPMS